MPSSLRRTPDWLGIELILGLLALAVLILLLVPVHFSAKGAQAHIAYGPDSHEGLLAGGLAIVVGLTCIAAMLRPWPALTIPLVLCALLLPFAAIGIIDLGADLSTSTVANAICPGEARYEEQPDLVSHFPGSGCVGHTGFDPLPWVWLGLMALVILTPIAIALRVPGPRWARVTGAVVAVIVLVGLTLGGSLIADVQHLE